MAKRRGGSARRRSKSKDPELEIVDESGDDDFAWQSPAEEPKKKKKKKKKSSTGSARTSGSTRKKKRGASSTSKRKSRRGSRDDDYDDDDEETSGSTRRRRAAPPKKKGVDPVIPISIVTAAILICLGIVFMNNRPRKKARDEPALMEEGKKLAADGLLAYKEWQRIKKKGPVSAAEAKRKEAQRLFDAAIKKYDEATAPYRDSEGILKKKYEGYEKFYMEISKYHSDLIKGSQLERR